MPWVAGLVPCARVAGARGDRLGARAARARRVARRRRRPGAAQRRACREARRARPHARLDRQPARHGLRRGPRRVGRLGDGRARALTRGRGLAGAHRRSTGHPCAHPLAARRAAHGGARRGDPVARRRARRPVRPPASCRRAAVDDAVLARGRGIRGARDRQRVPVRQQPLGQRVRRGLRSHRHQRARRGRRHRAHRRGARAAGRSPGGSSRSTAENDLALIAVDGLATPPLAIADAAVGADVAVAGYPFGGPLELRPARVDVERPAHDRGPGHARRRARS